MSAASLPRPEAAAAAPAPAPMSFATQAPRRLAIFGATGTVGANALDIARSHRDAFDVTVLTAASQPEALIALARQHQPEAVAIADATHYRTVRQALPAAITVLAGPEGLCEAAAMAYDCMVCAITGFAALAPTLAAIRCGRTIALANKECLVAAGPLIMAGCHEHGATLIPVDSEHNGLFQLWSCLNAAGPSHVTLTASGGPFRNASHETMAKATPAQAVAHPTWRMGAKISVDSATLMNKGLELIEARHLFALNPEQLRVLIHPQSIVHCLIALPDGAQLAQLSLPDMRTPLAHALHYPERLALDIPALSLAEMGRLTFEEADSSRFPCLRLAYAAMEAGPAACIGMNAANEVAVAAFLAKRIGFLDIAPLIERTLTRLPSGPVTTLDEVHAIDDTARQLTYPHVPGS